MQKTNMDLVLILGWGGAKVDQLSPVRNWYNSQGYESLIYITPAIRSLFSYKAWNQQVKVLADKLIGISEKDEVSLTVHSFSNNGFMIAGALFETLHCHPKGEVVLKALYKIILDSAPGFPNPMTAKAFSQQYANAFTQIILNSWDFRNHIVHQVISSILKVGFQIYWNVCYQTTQSIACAPDRWINYCPRVPQLYLYSHADTQVPSSLVKSFMESEKDRGVCVTEFCWEETPHIQHFRHHSDIYFQHIKSFLRNQSLKGAE